MNKNEFMSSLSKELKEKNISDIDEILFDFEEHFNFKLEEGYSEEEISKKLGDPKKIVLEYDNSEAPKKSNKVLLGTTLGVASVGFSLLYLFIFSSVLILGAFALAAFTLGFCFITTVNIGGIIPNMPYFPSFMLGLACFAVSILAAVGTIYLFLYVKHWGKLYINWCKNTYNQNKMLSSTLHPKITKKFSTKLKLVAIISLIIFLVTFFIAYASMCGITKSFEPWHVWKWFEN